MRTELDRSTLRSLGGVDVRGLIKRTANGSESVPVHHALAIVVSAAAHVHTAHTAGNRLIATPENVLVRYDGSVEIRSSRASSGDRRIDIQALGRLLVALLASAELPGDLAASIAALIDPDRGAPTAEDFARSLAQAARSADVRMSKGELGRWARRVVYPMGTASTPAFGVGTGAVEARPDTRPDTERDPQPGIAVGSGHFHEDDLVETSAVIDVERMIGQATAKVAPVRRPPTVVEASPRQARGSVMIGVLEAIAILVVLAAIGLALYQAFPVVGAVITIAR
jgi:hypothetical protein